MGGRQREVWKNDFSAISGRSHLDRHAATVFCQAEIRGGEVELLELRERESERREKKLLRLDFDELISFGFIRQTDRRTGEGARRRFWAQSSWTDRLGRGPTATPAPVHYRQLAV